MSATTTSVRTWLYSAENLQHLQQMQYENCSQIRSKLNRSRLRSETMQQERSLPAPKSSANFFPSASNTCCVTRTIKERNTHDQEFEKYQSEKFAPALRFDASTGVALGNKSIRYPNTYALLPWKGGWCTILSVSTNSVITYPLVRQVWFVPHYSNLQASRAKTLVL